MLLPMTPSAPQLADIRAAVYPVAVIAKIVSGGQTGVGTVATIIEGGCPRWRRAVTLWDGRPTLP